MGMITFEGTEPAHCKLPTHEYIAHSSPAAAGECGCPVRASNGCILRRDGDKTTMRPSAKLLCTLSF